MRQSGYELGRHLVTYVLSGKRIWVVGHRGMVEGPVGRRLTSEDCSTITAGGEMIDRAEQAEVAMRDLAETSTKAAFQKASIVRCFQARRDPRKHDAGDPIEGMPQSGGGIACDYVHFPEAGEAGRAG